MVLGWGHLDRNEYSKDNTQISSRFVASLLDDSAPKREVGLDRIMKYALHGTGIPRPGDLESLNDPKETITFYSFILDLKGPALIRHRAIIDVAHRYLKWKFLSDNVEDPDREEEFRDFAILNGFLILKEENEPPRSSGEEPIGPQGRNGGGRGHDRWHGHGRGRRCRQNIPHPGSPA